MLNFTYGESQNGVGILFSDFLNVDTTFSRSNQTRTIEFSVVHESQIVLLASVLSLGDHDRVANSAFGAGLLGDKEVTDHAFGRRFYFFGAVQ